MPDLDEPNYTYRRLREIEEATGAKPSAAVQRLIESVAYAYEMLPYAKADSEEAEEDADRNTARGLVLRIMSSIRATEKAALDLAEREARSAAASPPDLSQLREK